MAVVDKCATEEDYCYYGEDEICEKGTKDEGQCELYVEGKTVRVEKVEAFLGEQTFMHWSVTKAGLIFLSREVEKAAAKSYLNGGILLEQARDACSTGIYSKKDQKDLIEYEESKLTLPSIVGKSIFKLRKKQWMSSL